MADGKTTKERLIEFVCENPGYEAREVDEALNLTEKTMSCYAKALVNEQYLRLCLANH